MKSPLSGIVERYMNEDKSSNIARMKLMTKKAITIGAVLLVLVTALIVVFGVIRLREPERTGLILPPSSYSEHGKYYDILTSYATSTPLRESVGASADVQARSSMYGFITDTVAQFKSDGQFDSLTSEDIKMLGFDQGRKETLQITYRVVMAPHTVSYIYTIYEDTLGAHGNTNFKTFTFDLKSGAELGLADIFSGSSYLQTFSSISRAKLPAMVGDLTNDMLTEGTKPDAQNFQYFYFEKSDFVLLFPPYQVAPYAAGPQTLKIPLSKLPSLKADYK